LFRSYSFLFWRWVDVSVGLGGGYTLVRAGSETLLSGFIPTFRVSIGAAF
jgi:hypothetical protein